MTDYRFRVLASCLGLALLLGGHAAGGQALPRVTVAQDGKGQFTTVQAAVDQAPDTGEIIRIAPGTYKEKLHIGKSGIRLVGLGKTPADVVLTFDDSAKTNNSTTKSASVTVSGDNFQAENLTFENSFEIAHTDQGGQAVALLISGDRAVLDRVRFLGAQDTLYANSKSCHGSLTGPCDAARQYFKDCFIEGHVDYIFGDAKAVFDHCELHALKHGVITITAQSRTDPAENSGYTFLHSKITSEPGVGKLLLGRPWRPYSTVSFVDTDMQAKMDADGWSDWDGKLKTSDYREYDSHGPGVNGKKRIVSTPPGPAEVSLATLLGGKDHWDPTAEIAPLRAETTR